MGKNNGLTMLKYIKEDGTQLLQGMSTRKLWKKSRNMLQILGISPPPNKLGWDIQTFEWGTHKASFIGVHIALVNIVEELENTPSKGQRIGVIRKTI